MTPEFRRIHLGVSESPGSSDGADPALAEALQCFASGPSPVCMQAVSFHAPVLRLCALLNGEQ